MANMTAVISPDGTTRLTTIDLVEDLWYDYLTYRKQAEIAEKRGEVLRTKQHLRAAAHAFHSFITALANRWCAKVLATTKADPASFLSEKALGEKCKFLARQGGVDDVPVDSLAVASCVVAGLANLQPDNEVRLFESLSMPELLKAQDGILRWYDAVGQKLGFSKFGDTAKQGREFAGLLREISNEQAAYGGYAELRKDSEAWEKELQERRAWEGLGPISSIDQGSKP